MTESLTNMANKQYFNATFTAEFDEDQTAAAIITPTTGKKIKVVGVRLSTEGATSAGQSVRLYFTGDTVCKIFCTNAVQNNEVGPILISGAVSEALKITSTLGADKNYHLSINYREE